MLAITILIPILLIVYTLFWWRNVKQYWKKRNIPFVPPYPILGNLDFVARFSFFSWLRKLYEQYESSYLGIWLLWKPAILINCPDIARRILVNDFDAFRDRYVTPGDHDFMSKSIVSIKEPGWSPIRRRLSPMFTAAKLRCLENLMSTKAQELVRRIKNENDNSLKINLRSMFVDFTTDVFSGACFGVAGEATLTGDGAIRRVAEQFMTLDLLRAISFGCIFFCPNIGRLFKLTLLQKETLDYLRQIFQSVVNQRKDDTATSKQCRDLVDALIQMKSEAYLDKEVIDDDALLAQAAVFFQGGFDTIALTLTNTVYELAYSPEVQQKLFIEISEAKKNISEDLNGNLSELVFLGSVIKEVLRKYPAIPWIDRVALKDYKVNDNLTIAKGTPVLINTIGIHYDPNYYPEPEKFDPGRFLPGNETNQYAWLPFGDGPKYCIGKRFAYQVINYALYFIILNYEIRPIPGSPLPSDREYEKFGIFVAPLSHQSVTFVARHKM